MTKKKRFKTLGRLSGDGRGTIKDEAGNALTEQEAAEHLRLWEEMTTPDEGTKPDIDHLSEQELLDEASRVQKEVREERDAKAIGEALTLGFWPTGPMLAERFSEEQLKEFLNHKFQIVRTAAAHALYLKRKK